ncbi:MAG: AAA family ATPase, partial [Acidobacteriota bacterium]|nr:AAA family ATPase [Acidobacteriota bacterium]
REIDIPLNSSKIVSITGPRRSGKTYLFHFLIKQLIKGGFSPEQILYINFDNPIFFLFPEAIR